MMMPDAGRHDGTGPSTLPARWRRWLLVAALVALAVVLVATVALLIWEPWAPRDLPEVVPPPQPASTH
jgi:hypothetical protein